MPNVFEQINAVVVHILEDWALMLVDQAESNAGIFEVDQPFYISRVDFRGVVNGCYSVICQKEFATTLAHNLLGDDDNVTEEQIQDALKEMINVLSGNLLTETYGADHVFNLTSPEVKTAELAEVENLFERPHFCYRGEDQPVAVSFSLKGV